MMTHHTEFRAALKALGIKQTWLAERLGVHKSTVSHWTTGAAPIPKYATFAIALMTRIAAEGIATDPD